MELFSPSQILKTENILANINCLIINRSHLYAAQKLSVENLLVRILHGPEVYVAMQNLPRVTMALLEISVLYHTEFVNSCWGSAVMSVPAVASEICALTKFSSGPGGYIPCSGPMQDHLKETQLWMVKSLADMYG